MTDLNSPLHLTGDQPKRLQAALLRAFTDRDQLRRMAWLELGVRLNEIAPNSNLQDSIFELIDWAERTDKIRELLTAAQTANPDNYALRAIAAELGLLPAGSAGDSLVRPVALPPPNPAFVGRTAELERIAAGLAAGRVVAVTGTGGQGKTQLAVEFAHRHAAAYPGGIFWLVMDPPDEGAISGQIAAFHTIGGLPLADRVAAVQRAWADPTPRLLIFDNLEDPALLRRWAVPPGSGSRILISSRNGFWPANSGVQAIALEGLTGDVARALLLTPRSAQSDTTVAALLAQSETAQAADRFIADVDGHALALTLAAAFLEATRDLTLPAYVRRVQKLALAHPSLTHLPQGELPTGHSASILATFALSYDKLQPSDPTDTLALTLLHRAAYCAPAPIPRRLLYCAAGLDPDDDATPETAAPALNRLHQLGLLEALPDGNLRLHRLLLLYVQGRGTERASDQVMVEAALVQATMKLREDSFPLGSVAYAPHLELCVANGEGREDDVALALLNNLGKMLFFQGNWATALPVYERALAIRERLLDPDHLDTATCLSNLAIVLRALGHPQAARPLHERALAIRERMLGSDHPDTASSLSNLAIVLSQLGDPQAARPLHDRAFAIHERVLGLDHPDTARSLHCLASVLFALGDPQAARPLYERALATREQVLGPDHPSTARSLNSLASVLFALGDSQAALPLYERALVIRERVLGSDHPDTAIILSNLGILLWTQGDWATASSLEERALTISERVLGSDNPYTQSYRRNVAFMTSSK